jgi:geranylgeranyl reductase family protein
MNCVEVAIIGGGPAGASCAIELAKHGIYPTIFDHSHPREKPCAGGITTQVMKNFPFLETFRSKGHAVYDLRIISYNDIEVIAKENLYDFCLSRMLFDQGILSMALEKGAKLATEKVLGVKKTRTGWKIRTDKEFHFARILVGADGVNSIVRRNTVGPISKENLALTFGYRAIIHEDVQATIKFLSETQGYIWVFPGNDYVNIGIGGELNHGSMLKKLLDDFIHFHYSGIEITSKYAALLPSAETSEFFSLPCSGKDWILIGDAAGHVDPTTGEGIFYALSGGRLAALAIKENNANSYDDKWRKEYGQTLIRSVNKKADFYDPISSTIAILLGLASKIFVLKST